ncbi:zinc finger protein [Fragilaria crotonensis]|nr:zinc finger protein [Fragilaria crotonensis]
MVKTRRKRIKVEEESESHAVENRPSSNAPALEADQDPPNNCDPDNGTARNNTDVGSQSDGDDTRATQSEGEAKDDSDVDYKSDEREENTRKGGLQALPRRPKGTRCSGRSYMCALWKGDCHRPGFEVSRRQFCLSKRVDAGEAETITCSFKKRKKSIVGRPKVKESQRFRGSMEDRTCPKCKKVFTSVLGKNYHVKHGVCTEQSVTNLAGSVSFPTLEKGSRYITKYGVVEVVADDRGRSTYVYPDDIKEVHKKYVSHRDKQVVQKRKVYLDFGFQSRLRRRRLRRTYEFDNVRSDTTRNAYFGGTSSITTDAKPLILDQGLRQDPIHPPEALPDRIVVCTLIPDERRRLYSPDQDFTTVESSTPTPITGFQATLYLRRRELTKSYSPNANVFTCIDCGTEYTSKEGFVYHLQGAVCKKKAIVRAAQRKEMNDIVQARVERHLLRFGKRPNEKKRKGEMGVYAQVWLSLGFSLPAAVKAPSVLEKGDAIKFEMRVKELDDTLKFFREEIRKETVKRSDKKEGAMYASVFKSLNFKKPRPPKGVERSRQTKARKSGGGRKRENGEAVDDEVGANDDDDDDDAESPDVPIVDVQVLIDEAKTGRYPTIQRYDGDYPDDCVICKDGGDLLLCDFCCNAVHLNCILTKITITPPEPDEDFMCHVCARKIVSRRNRAEKRRLQKQESVLDKARQKAADRAAVEGHEEQKHESDYHAAAAVGKELSELIELLSDARRSLRQMVEVSKINQLRRLQLGV